jgi:hypothetical protein
VFSHNVKSFIVLKVLEDLDNVGVIQVSQGLNFIQHRLLLGCVHILFFKDFNSALFLGNAMSAETNLTEGTFTEDLTNFVNVTKGTFTLSNEHLSANFNVSLCFINHCNVFI